MAIPKKGSYNVIMGDAANNWLSGSFTLNDAIYGRGGNDYLFGYHGDDSLYGGDGRDYLSGSSGRDYLDGGDGGDFLYGGTDNDYLRGGAGGDTLDGGSGTDTVTYSDSGAGVFIDLLYNYAYGGDADGDSFSSIENVIGSSYNDSIYGTNSDNVIEGLAGSDWLYGHGGNDTLIGGDGADHMDGGTGIDTVSYAGATSPLIINLELGEGGFGAYGDSYYSIENVIGGDNGDTITGTGQVNVIEGRGGEDWISDGAGDDTIYGGAGDDAFNAGAGADDYFGGDDTDIVRFHESNAGVTVDLAAGIGSGGYAEGDTYDSIEGVSGSDHDDTLIGDDGDNVIYGNQGADVLIGGLGDDILSAGDYGDVDTFVFGDNQGLEADTIYAFESGLDRIDLTATEFSGFNDLFSPGDRYWEQDGADTVIHYYDHTITLHNVNINDLSDDNFLFA